MRLFIVSFTYIFCFLSLNAQSVKKTKAPQWVNSITIDDTVNRIEEGAVSYLLIDLQDNLIGKEQYIHYALKVLNGDGVQEFSDISASFDPTFQTLEFHFVQIVRNGSIIEKLSNSPIKTFQRETNHERSLYDGSLTAVLNLSDVREGDIIEYAYSIKGFNPVNKGNYASILYQQYTSPVNRIYSRLVTDQDNKIGYKLLHGASEPKILNSSEALEYIWDNSGSEHLVYENSVPYSYDVQKRVSVSTFKDWGEVGALLNPLYSIEKNTLKAPIDIDEELDSKQDIIIKNIRFVQDEIRYLGFESGIGAYKPNSPEKVLSRRYGDCKDKSLLLSNLLQNQGVNAHPILVSTLAKDDMDELLPSHYMFDHCIVYFEHGGNEYFVDPTISNQGGDLSHFATPDYKFGFVLNEGSKNLIPIPKPIKSRIRIVEDIVIDSIGGSATFSVTSEYTGSKADYMRSYFKNNTEESINKEYLNYYSSLYPTISSSDKISYTDDSRPWENIFTTNETYHIDSIWSTSDSDESIYFDTYSIVLDGLTNYSKSPKRKMPYYVGVPFVFSQTTRITLPELWSITDDNPKITGPGFSYEKQVSSIGKLVTISHKYELDKEVLDAESVPSFLDKNNEVREKLGYQLYYMTSMTSGSQISWISVFIAIISLFIGVFLAIRLYKYFDPVSEGEDKALSIGGWLVLPAIGLVLTPFILIFHLVSNDYFNKNIWQGFRLGGYENHRILNLYMGFELFYNIAFLVFTILLILMFFKRRTGLPKLMVIFYSTNLLAVLLGGFVLNQSGLSDASTFKDIFRAILSAAIWIPYFLLSKRVKETFTQRYSPDKLSVPEKSLI